MYFLIKGAAGYVLPRYDNKAYQIIEAGEYFGHVELVSDKILNDDMSAIWKQHVGMDRIRRFTV